MSDTSHTSVSKEFTASSGDILPSGTTAVASTVMAATPRDAKPYQLGISGVLQTS